ncbi:uncharacterized protein [Musca autumnalis]|uniref:uncharacterized protein n=1 Tax=Musca autumnalis TaxID=221902 RepID=UPI003CE83263
MGFLLHPIACVALLGSIFLPLATSKAVDNGRKHIEVFHKFRNLMIDVQPIIKAVLNEMPQEESYNKYRQDLENILQRINEKSGELCFDKHFADFDELMKLTKTYRRSDAPEEAKVVLKLIAKHGYKKYLTKKWFHLKKVDLAKYKVDVENFDKSQEKYKVFNEKC